MCHCIQTQFAFPKHQAVLALFLVDNVLVCFSVTCILPLFLLSFFLQTPSHDTLPSVMTLTHIGTLCIKFEIYSLHIRGDIKHLYFQLRLIKFKIVMSSSISFPSNVIVSLFHTAVYKFHCVYAIFLIVL